MSVSLKELQAAQIDGTFGTATGLAIRSIMLDTIQRYYAENPQGSAREKMERVKVLALDAAREHKDGIRLQTGVPLMDIDLNLTAAQKELAGRAWQKILADKQPQNVIAFLEDPELKGEIKNVPSIKDTPVDQLNQKLKDGMASASLADLAAAAIGLPFNVGPISKLKAAFERKSQQHGIMYHEVNGKTMTVETSFKEAVNAVKKDLGKASSVATDTKFAVENVVSTEWYAPVHSAKLSIRDSQLG